MADVSRPAAENPWRIATQSVDLTSLVREHHAVVYRYAFRLCGCSADAGSSGTPHDTRVTTTSDRREACMVTIVALVNDIITTLQQRPRHKHTRFPWSFALMW